MIWRTLSHPTVTKEAAGEELSASSCGGGPSSSQQAVPVHRDGVERYQEGPFRREGQNCFGLPRYVRNRHVPSGAEDPLSGPEQAARVSGGASLCALGGR